jgi:hypothetical protein
MYKPRTGTAQLGALKQFETSELFAVFVVYAAISCRCTQSAFKTGNRCTAWYSCKAC